VKYAADRIRQEHGVELGLIVIDTLIAAAEFHDENNNSEVNRGIKIHKAVGRFAKCVVMDVDHHGKATETGSRGASAKDASDDFVLATLGEMRPAR
jgi:hypothetical protein